MKKSLALLAISLLLITTSALAQSRDHDEKIASHARAIEQKVIDWRRDFHQNPELSNREFRTAKIVAEHLRAFGMEVQTEVAHTGVVGVLKGGKPGPVVALRADMDGLPVTEVTGLPYASTLKSTYNGQDVGVMHACGHDNHVAILMGAAEILAGMKEDLPGTVKFIFQPAEEGEPAGEEGGAEFMIKEGALKNPDVDAIFGLHITQKFEVGYAAVRPKGMMASSQKYEIDITGSQTHAARPWQGVDPIVIGSQIVMGLQTIVSRQVDLTIAPAVVSVSMFHGGVRNNIIPDTAKLTGTIRTFDPDMKTKIHERVRLIATTIAKSGGATAEVTIAVGNPVTYNDPDLTRAMTPTLARIYGDDRAIEAPRVTGAEDFSHYQKEIPGMFFYIGARPKNVPEADQIPNHSPKFYVNEAALLPAVQVMTTLALDYLEMN